MRDVYLVVDRHNLFQNGAQDRVKTEEEAQKLTDLIGAFGPIDERVAIVSERDDTGFTAYSRAGYQMVSMNGDRRTEISQFIQRTAQKINSDPPDTLVLVTGDKVFHYLLQDIGRDSGIQIRVWVPGERHLKTFANSRYHVQLLRDVLPKDRIDRVDIRLDFENLFNALDANAPLRNPSIFIETIEAQLAAFGDIVKIVAYGDWDKLPAGIQRSLAQAGVDTRYEVGRNGRNSTDMRIANDVRTLLERGAADPEAADVIVLGTNDRDFRPILKTANCRGRRIVLLACKNGLSQQLRKEAREIVYISHKPLKRKAKPSFLQKAHDNAPWPTDPHAELLVEIAAWLRARGWRWAPVHLLVNDLKLTKDGLICIDRAVADGVLKRKIRNNQEIVNLRLDHVLARTVNHLVEWLPEHIERFLKVEREQCVSTPLLVAAVEKDREFEEVSLGPNPYQVEAWLKLAARVGLIVSKEHIRPTGKTIMAWWLPEQLLSSTDNQVERSPRPPRRSPQSEQPHNITSNRFICPFFIPGNWGSQGQPLLQ